MIYRRTGQVEEKGLSPHRAGGGEGIHQFLQGDMCLGGRVPLGGKCLLGDQCL
jgi:hypothetical protein